MAAVSSARRGRLRTPTESRWTLNSGHRSTPGFPGCWLPGLTLTGFDPVSSAMAVKGALAGHWWCWAWGQL